MARRRRRWPWVLLAVVILLVVVSVAAVADAVRLYRAIPRIAVAFPAAEDGATDVLLVGADRRPPGSQELQPGQASPDDARADIILLLHVPEDGPARLVAIPRDLLVTLPDGAEKRLTLALLDGPQGLEDAVCDGLGIALDHMVEIDLENFAEMVDAVGGIEVDVAAPVRDEASGLYLDDAGVQHLDGATALAFIRSRQATELVDGAWVPVPDGASWRLDHTSQVMSALAGELRASSSNPFALRRLASTFGPRVAVDTTMDLGDMRDIARWLEPLGSGEGVERVGTTDIDGEIPVSLLTAGGARTLGEVGAGSTEACPTVPRARFAPSG